MGWNCECSVIRGSERKFVHMAETTGCIKEPAVLQGRLQSFVAYQEQAQIIL